jgi:hypothetical protein
MTCNECNKPIGEGEPMVVLYIALNEIPQRETFTGIVWHPACAPAERSHLLDEAEQISHAA